MRHKNLSLSKESQKRLLAYASAAGVGAFALPTSGEGAFFVTDLSDNPITRGHQPAGIQILILILISMETAPMT